MPTENQRFCTLLSSISIFLNLFLLHCYAATCNITSSNPLSQNEILISPAQVFELSFFHLDNSTNQYVGIWYKNIAPRTVAWVANRENPVIDSLASLKIGSDGNLKLVDGNEQLWQSFEHQVNTFLPGAGIEYDLETVERHVLSSCKSNNDQSRGDFVTEIVPQSPPQAFIWNGSVPYWRSREWNKLQFIGLPGMDSTYSRAISLVLTDQESGYFYVSLNTTERVMVILSEGTLKIMCWGKDTSWCLEGFVPKSDEEWNKNNWTGGCIRRTELSCLARTSLEALQGEETDKFWKMNGIKLPDKSKYQEAKDVNKCGQWCLNNCSCKACAYVMGIGCLLWSEDLIDMQEFSSGGEDLFIHLASSELVFLAHRKLRVDLIISLTTVSCIIILGALVYGLCWQRSKTIVAINNFSMANKLGQGGYGPVYKDHAENRPTMAAVISMLSNETELLQPKEPIFTFHNPSKFDQPKDNNPCPICEITMSLAEGQ
ncbi:hypothetical protein SLA2020_385710 [Shorea laevis]